MENFDYIIVGSGLTGSVIARLLTDSDLKVCVLERQVNPAGNLYDEKHESGIFIHKYGPHYFRTSNDRVWSYLKRFSDFYEYVPCIKANINGKLENWPIAASYIKKEVGENWIPEFHGKPKNFEESSLSLMPRKIYNLFVKEYNEKQWGIPCTDLSDNLITRFEIRHDDDPRLKNNYKYQGIPVNGYTELIKKMLAGIKVIFNVDYLKFKNEFSANRKIIFTGPIDEYFGYRFGKLKYRGQKREEIYLEFQRFFQGTGQINEPLHNAGKLIRTIEWKHLMPKHEQEKTAGTIITRETPYTPKDPDCYEYPFPDEINSNLYQRYKSFSKNFNNVLFAGRLGEYKYYDMDHSIERAFAIVEKLEPGLEC